MKIIAATKNKGKIREINGITADFGYDFVPRDQAGIPDVEVVEDGETFEENSFKKASEIMALCNMPTMADDSGLMVDALDGAPGVYSSRFAGEDGNDKANYQKLLECLKDVPVEKRTARFVTVITMLWPDGRKLVAKGTCEGHIALEPQGDHGFGYDPVFIPEGYSESFGLLPAEIKQKISHRAKALAALRDMLEKE